MDLLEKQVEKLVADIDAMRRAHLDTAERSLREQRRKLLQGLESMVAPGAGLASHGAAQAVRDGLQELNARFGPASHERTAIVDYNFHQVRASSAPAHSAVAEPAPSALSPPPPL